MNILLSDEEMKALKPDVPMCEQTVFGCDGCSAECGLTARAQLKKVKQYWHDYGIIKLDEVLTEEVNREST